MGVMRTDDRLGSAGAWESMKDFVCDPRDFISRPYWDCPFCGAQRTFGVSMVLHDHYVRRCRTCLCDTTHSLPPVHKKVIYLDQFVISNMMKALNPQTKAHKKRSADPYWAHLFAKLHSLCKLQLIVCPDSSLHEQESALAPQFYRALKRMYELLSHAVGFDSPTEIKQLQIGDGALNWVRGEDGKAPNLDPEGVVDGKVHGWQQRLILSADIPIERQWVDELRTEREQAARWLKERFCSWAKEGTTFEQQFDIELRAFPRTLLKLHFGRQAKLAAILEGKHEPALSDLYPDLSSSLILSVHSAFTRAGVRDSELWPKTLEYLLSDSLRNVPFIRISAMLYAALARRAASGRKRPPDRGMMSDIRIISVLLPYCDAMFIDNECRGLLCEEPLSGALDYGTTLFSTNNKERFLNYLDDIKSRASPEHLDKVKEVYGEDWEKPYTTLYQPGSA